MTWQKDLVELEDSEPRGLREDRTVMFEERARVTLVLRGRDEGRVHELLEEHGSRLPHERRRPSGEEIEKICGPDPAHLSRIEDFAKHFGLEVIDLGPHRRFVRLEGPLRSLASAFGVEFVLHRERGGSFRSHRGAVKVPRALSAAVVGVVGLDTRPRVEPCICLGLATDEHYDPREIAKAYDFPPELDGKGETLAIVVLGGGFHPEDVDAYFRSLKLETRPCIQWVGCNSPSSPEDIREALRLAGVEEAPLRCLQAAAGRESQPASSKRPTIDPATGWTIEATTDLELAAVLAPGARVVVYFFENSVDGMIQGINRPYNDGATVVSNSWASLTLEPNQICILETALSVAMIAGTVTYCFASGDYGDGTKEFYDSNSRSPQVCYPAASTHVLGCGGADSDPRATATQRVWDERIVSKPAKQTYHFGGGGGVAGFLEPPAWQKPAEVERKTGRKGRGVPDVAAKADMKRGYRIIVGGEQVGMGGTSSATPLWAALICRISQGLGHPVGNLTPQLYDERFRESFTDIVTGKVGQNRAAPGWDPCTGLGTPLGTKLLAALRGD